MISSLLTWNAFQLVGAALVLFGFLAKGFQITTPAPDFLVRFWTTLRNTHVTELPRFMIRQTLGFLGVSAQVLSIISSLATLIAIFFLVSLVGYVYELNHQADKFELVRANVQAFRDGTVYLFVALMVGALAIFIPLGILVAQQEEGTDRQLSIGLLGLLGGLLFVGVTIYQMYRVVMFTVANYAEILSTSLSGTPIEALQSQVLLIPLNAMAFGLPTVILSWLLVWQFQAPLARALVPTPEGSDEAAPSTGPTSLPASARSAVLYNDLIGRLGLNAGVTASFILTALAIYIGGTLQPEENLRLTPQLFLSNVVCDGLTLFGTVLLLGIALSGNAALRLPFVLVADLTIAASLGVLSLYVGLHGTEQAVTLKDATFVLIGGSTSGSGFHFGSKFWAMHTTFIPTLFFWFIIVAAIIGKLILTFIGNILGLHEKTWALETWGGTFLTIGSAWKLIEPYAFSAWQTAREWIQTML